MLGTFWFIAVREFLHSFTLGTFQISVRAAWANRKITMEIRTFNVPCSDLSVVWRMTWEDVTHGKYRGTTLWV